MKVVDDSAGHLSRAFFFQFTLIPIKESITSVTAVFNIIYWVEEYISSAIVHFTVDYSLSHVVYCIVD